MEIQELLAMPYDQRRLIVVTAPADGEPTPGPADSPAASRRPSPGVLGAAMLIAATTTVTFNPLLGLSLAPILMKAGREMRQGGENLIAISPEGAAGLNFPVGHPRRNVLYIGHPVNPPVYIPAGDFHRFLFEHKVAEALRLIRSLGAVTVEVVRIEGWDQTAGITLGASDPGTRASMGVSASRERGGGYAVLSTMRLRPTQDPSVPPGLVWLSHEPLWQEVAQARLESGLDSFVIDVRSTDDYGVNAGLRALVAKAGLEVGGSFVEHRNTIWQLRGTFS